MNVVIWIIQAGVVIMILTAFSGDVYVKQRFRNSDIPGSVGMSTCLSGMSPQPGKTEWIGQFIITISNYLHKCTPTIIM